jgi:perosamine synthetase
MFEGRPANVMAYDIASRAINLPSYHDISDRQLDRVVAVIQQLCSKGSVVAAQ